MYFLRNFLNRGIIDEREWVKWIYENVFKRIHRRVIRNPLANRV